MDLMDEELILRVSKLANISLNKGDLESHAFQLRRILDFFHTLDEIDTGMVEPAIHAVDLEGPLRPDEAKPSLSRDEIMGNTTHKFDGFYKIPKVIE